MNKGKIDILLGLQWGDEGKGKIVDVLTPNYDHVARFQGGPNAGHTLEFNGKHVVLRSIPSGVFQCNGVNIIGNGVVFDPILFKKEFEELSEHIPAEQLAEKIVISNKCHVITPFHKIQDMVNELRKGKNKVGTTGKGIGPTYTDKVSRIGILLGDLLNKIKSINDKLSTILFNLRNSILGMKLNIDDVPDEYKEIIKKISSKDINEFEEGVRSVVMDFINALLWLKKDSKILITNTTNYINNELSNNKSVLAEGAQGTMLDIDFGTYPYVTSSNTTSGGVCTGLGIAPNKIQDIYGIFKAYCTRVGAGPFPTEQDNEIGEHIRQEGHEFGAVTGRNRRCGWLDLVQLKYACIVNGVTQLIMMKSDVLNIFDEIKVCTSYNTLDGEEINGYPDVLDLSDIVPNYTTLKGWKNYKLTECHTYDQLPLEFKNYVEFIENYIGVPITILSIGPDRNQTIKRN